MEGNSTSSETATNQNTSPTTFDRYASGSNNSYRSQETNMNPSVNEAIGTPYSVPRMDEMNRSTPPSSPQRFDMPATPETSMSESPADQPSTIVSNLNDTPKRTEDPGERLAAQIADFEAQAAKVRAALVPATTFEERLFQAKELITTLFGMAPTWICYYREFMSANGLFLTLFKPASEDSPNGPRLTLAAEEAADEVTMFLQSDVYKQFQTSVAALRSRDLPDVDPNDPQRMITIRLPKSLHKQLCDEADALDISVNKLCISRMLQDLDVSMVPNTLHKRRGRRPGPQPKRAKQESAAVAADSTTTEPTNNYSPTSHSSSGSNYYSG